MDTKELIALGALIVAVLGAIIIPLVLQMRAATGARIKEVNEAWKAECKEIDDAWRTEVSDLRREYEARIASMHHKVLEQTAALSQVKLELVQATVNVPTRDQLNDILDRAMQPVAEHMRKTENFIERIYQSGILIDRRT